MKENLKKLHQEALSDLEKADNLVLLQDVRVKFFGKKGAFTSVMKGMSVMTAEERPKFGQLVNAVRAEVEAIIEEKQIAFKNAAVQEQLQKEKIDVTLPGRRVVCGHKHPITKTINIIKKIFTVSAGFTVAEGPEAELDFYNFEALNLPADHPARDMQDTFYLTESILLRTHTSPVQVRAMLEKSAKADNQPIRIIAPGKVYRCDFDATHSPMFHQVEGLLVDKGITFADLKGTLAQFLRAIFGKDVKVRFRASFFPFTEPSAEVDVSCVICGGKDSGCRVCKGTGWLEILGAGMVRPCVLKNGGYDPEVVSGFAFGMGVERIAMLLYGIDDLRLFFENDLRFLEQF